MNIRQMEIFLKVIESGSFLSAASGLFMSQSAVSQQISRMEQELGFTLFHRNGHGIQLTEAGTYYAAGVREILNIHRTTVAACLGSNEKSIQTTIGCTGFTSSYLLPQAMKQMQDLFPNARIDTCRVEPHHIVKALEEKEIDLAYVPEHISRLWPKIRFQLVAKAPLYCVIRKDSPLAGMELISQADLLDTTIVMPDEKYCSDQLRNLVSSLRALNDNSSFQTRRGTDIDNALIQVLADKRCVAVAPVYTLPAHADIVTIPLDDHDLLGVGFSYVKRLSLLEEELLKCCQQLGALQSK